MATIKSYTDIEQSRKLAKILPLESADGGWYGTTNPYAANTHLSLGTKYSTSANFPAWSLTALLDIIPKPELVQNSEETWLVRSWINDYPWSVGGYNNPIDACVAMIEKLHELKML